MGKGSVKVYRIENKAGEGFYLPKDMSTSIYRCPSYSDDGSHPNALEDSRLQILLGANNLLSCGMLNRRKTDKYSYGFGTIDQLRHWLYNDEWLVYLHKKGFKLVICQVVPKNVMLGNTQCMFIKPEKYVKRDIVKYFKLSLTEIKKD